MPGPRPRRSSALKLDLDEYREGTIDYTTVITAQATALTASREHAEHPAGAAAGQRAARGEPRRGVGRDEPFDTLTTAPAAGSRQARPLISQGKMVGAVGFEPTTR